MSATPVKPELNQRLVDEVRRPKPAQKPTPPLPTNKERAYSFMDSEMRRFAASIVTAKARAADAKKCEHVEAEREQTDQAEIFSEVVAVIKTGLDARRSKK